MEKDAAVAPLADGDSVNDCVRVAVRIRPMIGREQFQKCEECITIPASNPNQVRTRCISQLHDQSRSGGCRLVVVTAPPALASRMPLIGMRAVAAVVAGRDGGVPQRGPVVVCVPAPPIRA